MPSLSVIIIYNIIFYILCISIPFAIGMIISRSRLKLEKKLKLIRMIFLFIFIAAFLVYISQRDTYSLSHLLLRQEGSHWSSVLFYFLLLIGEIVLINTLALTLPRFYFTRKLRNTRQKALPSIGGNMLIMVLQLMSWMTIWIGYILLLQLFPRPWISYPLLGLWVLFILILIQSLMRAFMIRKKDRDLNREKVLFGSIQELAVKADVKLHRMVYIKTRESKIANAWAWGGLRPMIALYDYLYENMNEAEREIIIFHELGHIKLHHTLIRILLTVFSISLSLFLINLLLNRFEQLDSIYIFIVSQSIILLCTFFLPAFLYRHQEHQADLFALRHVSDPGAFVTAMMKLSRLNHSETSWKKGRTLISTHPHILRRIKWLEQKTGNKLDN